MTDTKSFNSNTTNNDEWLTPPSIIKALGDFDLDPCSPIIRPWNTATHHYSKEDDGLVQPWEGRVWLNPPYGNKTFIWLDKLSSHEGGGLALIFSRTETIGFHKEIWDKAHSIFFFKGRLKFHKVDGSQGDCANAPSCLVSYTKRDTESIKDAQSVLKGKLIELKPSIKPLVSLKKV